MNKFKVLIIEDDRLIAENSMIMLQKAGYDVCGICSTAQEAQRKIQEDRPDIALIDILLSGENDGIVFAESLRAEHDIPFVYVTSNSDPQTLERAKLTAPYGYIVKPFSSKDLQSNIEMALYKFETESKIEKLNEILYALNDMNRLEVKGQDDATFLDGACKILTRFPAFYHVWAALLDTEQNIVFETQADPQDQAIDARPVNADGQLAECITTCLRSDSAQVQLPDNDTFSGSELAIEFPGMAVISSRLATGDHVFGCMVIVIQPRILNSREFLHLVSEYTRKIGDRLLTITQEKQVGQTEIALVHSRSQMKQLTDIAPNMIIFQEPKGRITYVNPTVIKILGYKIDEILNHRLEDFLDARSILELDVLSKRWSKAEIEVHQTELTFLSKSGEDIPALVSSNPVHEQDKISSVVLLAHDLRDRKRQEAQLSKLSHVVEESPSAIIITNSEGRISYVNKKFVTMTGFIREEVEGEFPAILKTSDITEETSRDLIQTVKGGGIWRGKLRAYRTNQEKFWAYTTVSALTDAEGKFSYIGIIEDITDKLATQTDLKFSRQSFTDVFNATSDAIYILNQQGKFITVNNGACKMYGFDREYFIGKSPADLAAEGYNDLPKVQHALELAYNGQPQRFEFWGKRKSGEVFPKDVQLNKIRYFDKEAVMATSRDISEQKAQAKKLQQALDLAEQSERLKGYILANMTHEIRTPLTSMLGYIDLLFHEFAKKLPEKGQEYYDVIRRNSERLTHTVGSIIDLSQIEAGTMKLELKEVDLKQLVQAIWVDQNPDANEKKLKFNFHIPDGSFLVRGAREALHTSISNLVENAITYTESGQIDIFLNSMAGGSFQLEVRDTGIGIAEDSLETIFESFNQESMGYTKDYQGLGLGLTVARKTLELHDCTIDVQSKKGEGSAFFVNFPQQIVIAPVKSEIPVRTPEATPPPEPTPQTLKQVLIVEDDANAQRLFGLFLKDDYHVHLASTVAEGRACLQANSIDLVITDLSLVGGEDGIDLVKWVRQQQPFTELPVLALTAHALEADRVNCMHAGCNDFITKPIFRDQLREKLRSFLGTNSKKS